MQYKDQQILLIPKPIHGQTKKKNKIKLKREREREYLRAINIKESGALAIIFVAAGADFFLRY